MRTFPGLLAFIIYLIIPHKWSRRDEFYSGREISDEDEVSDLLKEIETILDTSEYEDVLWNGDINYVPSRNSGFARNISSFLERVGLTSVWEHFPIDYTHIHTDLKSVSTLDHFIANRRLIERITDCGVMHLGDNPSRHSPIILKLDIGSIPKRSKTQKKKRNQPAWYKATQEDKDNFTMDLYSRLAALETPDSLLCRNSCCQNRNHSEERDSHVLDILIAVIESSHTCIPSSGGGRVTADPRKACKVSQSVPGWQEHVKPFREDSVFWHAVWRSAGRPIQGDLFENMKKSRNSYHYAVRKVKKKADMIRAQRLLEASEASSVDLLNEMKKIKGKKKSSHDLPDEVEGTNGEANIVETFCKVYEELYNSSGSQEALAEIKLRVTELIAENNGETEVDKVTGDIVKKAACRMKAGKGDVSEGYTSDTILNAPDIFFEMMAGVYKSWLIHGTVSLNLLSCAFLPLLKNSQKNPAEVNSYRAIAGSSLMLKLFDQVILLLWGHLMSGDSLQFGYKAGASTSQCSWFVMEIANYFVKRGTPCIITLLDCTKAFDKCRFDVIFAKLLTKKIPAIVIRVLIYVYEEQRAWVKWGDARSRAFSLVNGTRQGSVLSPALFSLYMDDLLVRLRKAGVGCHLGSVFCGVVGYADDLLLLAPSRSAMEQMLRICEVYAEEHNLEFSTHPDPSKSKSKCIFMQGHMKQPKPTNLQLYGIDLPWVKTATHLGHELSEDCNMEVDMKVKRAEFIRISTDIRESFNFAQPNQILQAVRTYCGSIYGAMTWSLFSDKARQVFNCWSTCVKLSWGVTRSTHTYLVDNLLAGGMPSLRSCTIACFWNFYHGVMNSNSLEVKLLANLASKDIRSTMGANISGIRKICSGDLQGYSKIKVEKMILGAVAAVPASDSWRIGCLTRFLEMRHQLQNRLEDTTKMDRILDSLCSS